MPLAIRSAGDVATALYLGILSDTGSFRYSSANAEAFDVAGKLIATGLDPWDTASNLYESYAPERMRLLGIVLPTLELSPCGRYASMIMSRDDLSAAGASAEHADGFVNYPRAIRGVEVALFSTKLRITILKSACVHAAPSMLASWHVNWGAAVTIMLLVRASPGHRKK